MPVPELFSLSSDYPTLKNDDRGSTTVTFPGSVNIPSNTVYSVSSDLVVGSYRGEPRLRIKCSGLGSQYYLGQLLVNRLGTVGGIPTAYTIYAIVTRVNTTTIRCTAFVPNPNPGTLVCAATPEVFTYKLSTFLSPSLVAGL